VTTLALDSTKLRTCMPAVSEPMSMLSRLAPVIWNVPVSPMSMPKFGPPGASESNDASAVKVTGPFGSADGVAPA